MAYKPGTALATSSGQTWVTLIAAPSADEIIAVKSLTYDNLDNVTHKYSFALLISGTRYTQITTAAIAVGVYDFVTMSGLILLTTTGTSLQFRTEEVLSLTESKVTAHYARRS